MMVTEYMQGGDLGTALANDNAANRRLGWYNKGSHVALDIARGLAYLHHRKVRKPCMGCHKHAQAVASLRPKSPAPIGPWCEQGSCYNPLPTTSKGTLMRSAATAAGLPSWHLSMTHHNPETTALHAQVISFDVKPANVLLDRGGKHAKLADVGLAKVLEHSQTMTNMVGCPPG
jgi:serine/threonine protein kinase